jgi:hypothetical protein
MHLAAFQVTGQGAPPNVTFSGPHGIEVTTPTDAAGSKTEHTWLYKDPATNTTNLAISGDLAGTWTITPQPGSAPVVSVTDSYARPPVSVKAHVGGSGRSRTLVYSLKPQPGQKVVFAEIGKNVRRVVGSARGARGKLRFSPADGKAGRRRIVAQVTQNGLPRKQLNVASYRAPGPLRPRAPRRVGVIRAKNKLRVSWPAVKGAARYELTLTTFNHRKQLFVVPAKRRTQVIRDILPSYRAVLSVRGVSRNRQLGKAARVTVKPKKARRIT